MRKIMTEQRIIAHDQNCVFVDRASARVLPPRIAEEHFGLEPGRGNAYIEFDADDSEIQAQYNLRMRFVELYLVGDVRLHTRNPVGIVNRG
jgi:hypothetical protein